MDKVELIVKKVSFLEELNVKVTGFTKDPEIIVEFECGKEKAMQLLISGRAVLSVDGINLMMEVVPKEAVKKSIINSISEDEEERKRVLDESDQTK